MSTEDKNYKDKQQDLTELNGDGNRDRGHYGEDLSEEQELKRKIEELRKRDPFVYR